MNGRRLRDAATAFLIIATRICAAESEHTPPIRNAAYMNPFFEKLAKLETTKTGKVSIAHIGDSHVQADIFTDATRGPLQQRFGDGGRGFVFPYNRNKASARRPYNFATNAEWRICRNSQTSRCDSGAEFGLSGYGFSAKTDLLALSVEAREAEYDFNTIKVVAPTASSYRLAVADGDKNPIAYNETQSIKIHKVKRGETPDNIAKLYNVPVAAIKSENKLKSNSVQVGRNLRIPITTVESGVDTALFSPVDFQCENRYVLSFHQAKPMSAIYILGAPKQDIFNINGLIVENDTPGLIYHTVGSVGATAGNFNATPLFFEQLPALRPDLVVISFGTNESYGKLSTEAFMESMRLLIDNVKKRCGDTPILITTPPFSLLRHKRWNTYAENYSEAITRMDGVAVWDLYAFTTGLIKPDGNLTELKISKDNVHYTIDGYVNQGTAFADALLDEYDRYKRSDQ